MISRLVIHQEHVKNRLMIEIRITWDEYTLRSPLPRTAVINLNSTNKIVIIHFLRSTTRFDSHIENVSHSMTHLISIWMW